MNNKISAGKSRVGDGEFVTLMAFLMSIVALSIDAMLPALGYIGEDLRVTHPNQAQYVIGCIFIGMAAGQLICGPLSDAIGRKRVIYGALLLYLIGSVICYGAGSLDMMLVGRLIQGVGVAGPYVCSVSIVRDKYSGRQMARVMSLVMMIFIMVPAIAPTIGQGILTVGSWRDIFILYVVYATVVIAWLGVRLEETLTPENRVSFTAAHVVNGFKEVFSNRITISYTLCMGLFFGSFIGYLNSAQQIFQVQFQTGEMFTVYFGGLALIMGVSSLLNSRIVERFGMRYLSIRAILMITISSVVFFVIHYIVPVQFWMFLMYIGILFFSLGLLIGNLNALAMEPMGHIAGIAAAIIGAVSSVIAMTLGTAIGQMYDNTLLPMVTGFALLGTLSFLIMKYAATEKGSITL